ncbi:MAG TPA: hypothetical protein VMH04_08670 [Candidatus Solibacter sp.]|nr:hypothetical protein [Candidatus Solibacter sp.]
MSETAQFSARSATLAPAASAATDAPSSRELACLVCTGFALFALCIVFAKNYAAAVETFGDSGGYVHLAAAIRHWNFHGIVIKQFWGLSYAMAGLSMLTGIPDLAALLVLSLVPSLLATLLARRLWNAWVAGYFAILNFDWLQRSCLGGTEPLFVCLILAAFLCVRRERWLLASLLASYATIVRPLGIFALVGIGLTLLWRRDFKRFALATIIGLAIGTLYCLPLMLHFGDALANVNSYHSKEWQGGWLFGVPFLAIIKGFFISAPWTNIALSVFWISMVASGVVMMVRSSEFREYCQAHSVEAFFLVGYLWCLFAYNYPAWARSNFARFAIPVLPFVLLALYRWVPKDRRLLWGLGVVMPLLAASSALGIVNILHRLRSIIG